MPVSKKERGLPMTIDRSPTSQSPTALLPLSQTMRDQVHPLADVLCSSSDTWDSYISAMGMDTGTEGSGGDVNMESAAGEPAVIDPVSFLANLNPSLRPSQAVLIDQEDDFLRTLPSHMIAEAGVYSDEVHARRFPTSRNPTAFAAEQGLPATGISQYEALADAGGSQKAESDVYFDERSHSSQPRSSNTVPIGSQTDVLPAQVPKVNMTTGRVANVSHRRRKQDANLACPIPGCGFTFTRGFNLEGHLRSHFEDKLYKCHWPGCGKGFARQQDVIRHEQLHANFQPYECEWCTKKFASMVTFNRHLSECVGVMERGKGTGGVLGDLDSGIKIYIHDGPQRRLGQTGGAGSGDGGVDIWSGMTL